MNFENYKLPTNKKFGFFFTTIFCIAAIYAFYINKLSLLYIFSIIGTIFFIITIYKEDLLFPLNKLWMKFGVLLGMIVSPIVLAIIFFGLFTPIALITRLAGRDELRLKLIKKKSYWIVRSELINSESFKRQF